MCPAADAGRIERIVRRDRRAIERQAEQAVDLPAPGIQLARGMGIGVDDAGGSADTLQPDRLPHQQHFVVGRGAVGSAGGGTRNCAPQSWCRLDPR